MALILIALSLFAGLSIGLWAVVSIPPPAYAYLTVVFLVVLDGLLYSYHRLEHAERIWARLAQRMALQLAYGAFIIFFGAKAERDLLLLAVIPLGFNVFANFVQLVPREAGEIYWVPRSAQPLDGEPQHRYAPHAPQPPMVVEALPAQALSFTEVEIEPFAEPVAPSTPVSVPASPGSITTITVSTVPAPAAAPTEEPPLDPPAESVTKAAVVKPLVVGE